MKDREIDALIAEKVMGFKITIGPRGDIGYEFKPHHYLSLPHYSIDIAASFQVVEKLDKDHCFHLICDRYGGISSHGKWIAYFGVNPGGVTDGAWGGDTEAMEYWDNPIPGGVANDSIPMAICLSALAVVGVKVEESK